MAIRNPSVPATLWSGARTGAFHLVAGVLAVLFLFPLLWAVLNSLKSPTEANASPPTFLPSSLSLGNYETLGKYGAGIAAYTGNSLLVALVTVGGTVVFSVLAGYGFSRYEFRGKNLTFVTILAILMVPYATMLLPLYLLLGVLGLQDSLIGLGLVLVMFQLPFGVLIMRNAFDSIPRELEEAAFLDGAGALGALRHVSLRIVTPGVVTVGLFAFLASWNEFLAPLIFLNTGDKFTLPLMLVSVREGTFGQIDFGALQAGIVVAMVPCVALYLVLNRYYVTGLLNGALRG
ncbi:carbohydrate ABC transporter permease [Nonomuraea jiangxiensis]|uniref:Multiple sugar transport system permease protein n=1 Tax=Nonomuraea jiangxiensis TaxID=633440 RepID=A0A1G8DLD2_9ACTN|nr:carbohydrate ABC transporter permease [Nonomuraea jiangxiensis]SDH58462.1 multiple sugar transport system permease protein [Nonomuraea jiangxiensis]